MYKRSKHAEQRSGLVDRLVGEARYAFLEFQKKKKLCPPCAWKRTEELLDKFYIGNRDMAPSWAMAKKRCRKILAPKFKALRKFQARHHAEQRSKDKIRQKSIQK